MRQITVECSTCTFFTNGKCYRYPPPDTTGSGGPTAFPAVLADDTCGEWHTKERIRATRRAR